MRRSSNPSGHKPRSFTSGKLVSPQFRIFVKHFAVGYLPVVKGDAGGVKV